MTRLPFYFLKCSVLRSYLSPWASRRYFSSPLPDASEKTRSRVARINSTLPKFLQRYTARLTEAPLSHVISFLVLHEVTAVLPLFSLAGLFHYTQWTPSAFSEGKWFNNGVEKFGSYFKKKGWLDEEDVTRRRRWWGRGEAGLRLITEYAPRP